MALEDDIAFFERVPTLAALGKQALRVLAIGAEARHLPSGAVLFYAGELADGGYIVQSGALSVEPGASSGEGEYTIGPGALVAAGSVIVRDVAADAVAVARGAQVEKPGRAKRFREMMSGRKKADLK